MLTATDVHKASFKCQYPGEYTFFADALFNQAGAEQLSITDWMGAAQKSIQAQEKRKRLASSAPKMFVGKKPRPGPASRSRAGCKPAEPGRNSPNGRRTN